jgi:hypothetical protein
MPLEILNGAFVLRRRSLCLERAGIFSFPRLRIFLLRVQPILPDFSFLIMAIPSHRARTQILHVSRHRIFAARLNLATVEL